MLSELLQACAVTNRSSRRSNPLVRALLSRVAVLRKFFIYLLTLWKTHSQSKIGAGSRAAHRFGIF
jgi:hypothetical protein